MKIDYVKKFAQYFDGYVYVLYQTDKWHSRMSKVLFYIGMSVGDCANALKAKYGGKLLTDEGYQQLLENRQTDMDEMDWEFIIEVMEVGEMFE